MNKKNKNSENDSDLWNYVMNEIKVIPKKKLYKDNDTKNLDYIRSSEILDESIKKSKDKLISKKTLINNEQKLKQLNYSRIDKSLTRKLKKGELFINKTLDLHGFNQNQAYKKLSKFIETNYKSGNRFLLVITGKGRKRNLDEPKKFTLGVLRSSLPIWLEETKFKEKIISHQESFNRHGGEGARYIILRKNKTDKNFIK